MWDANPVFRCARIEGQYEYCSEIPMCVCATLRPHPPERRATVPHEAEPRTQRPGKFRTGCVRCSCKLSARVEISTVKVGWRNPAVIGQQSGGEGRVGRSVCACSAGRQRLPARRGPSDQLLRGWTGRVGGCLKSTGNHPRAPGQPWASFSHCNGRNYVITELRIDPPPSPSARATRGRAPLNQVRSYRRYCLYVC